MRFIFLVTVFILALPISPAHSQGDDLTWGLAKLKEVSGLIGAGQACNNQVVTADAIQIYRSLLKSLITNSVIKEEDVPHVIDMNATTVAVIKRDFFKDSPVACADLPDVLLVYKQDLGLE